MAKFKLYEVVARKNPAKPFPLFCPTAVKVRLALLEKGIKPSDLTTVDVTYHDLRFIWKEKLGVEQATTPFIETEDGEFIMDSEKIVTWLDETYPDSPSPFTPLGSVPVDVKSAAYAKGLAEMSEFRKLLPTLSGAIFTLFAPVMTKDMDKDGPDDDFHYWTSEKRLGPERSFASMCAADPADIIAQAKKGMEPLNALLTASPKFFASPTVPGWKDFTLYGTIRLIKSTSPAQVKAIFDGTPMGQWLIDLETHFKEGLDEVNARDPK